MSWQDRYTQNLKITCGDAEVFELHTLPSFTKELEFNGTEFSFVEIEGELIKKRKLKSRTFPLEFFFIGEDHLEDAKSFEFSASHPDPWTIEHPYYDTILAQVLSIKFDDSDLNVTKVTCLAKQTITDGGYTVQRSDPRDVVLLKKVELDDMLSAQPEISPSITEIDTVLTTADSTYREGVKIISVPAEAEEYFNAFNEAISLVNTIVASPVLAIQALTNLLSLPGQFTTNVKDRMRVLGNQIDLLRRTLNGLVNKPSKQLYQTQHVALISAMCNAAVNPLEGDYTNASNALYISTLIKARHEQFLTDMDTIQGPNGGDPDNFIPEFDPVNGLADLVALTTSSLFEIALAGRKEMIFVLPADSNIFLMTHRFYGLDPADDNLVEFIDNNNLTAEEIALGLAKGKSITYYV